MEAIQRPAPAGGASACPAAGDGPGRAAPVAEVERDSSALGAALLRAHAAGDQAGLVRLYACAADRAEAAGETDAACFYLTHAYVFALATGAAEADALHARLKARGREE